MFKAIYNARLSTCAIMQKKGQLMYEFKIDHTYRNLTYPEKLFTVKERDLNVVRGIVSHNEGILYSNYYLEFRVEHDTRKEFIVENGGISYRADRVDLPL